MDDNSQMEGMVIKISKDGAGIKGEIVSLPSSATYFELGQIKWKILSKESKDTYTYLDLTGGRSTDNKYAYSEQSYMKLSKDGRILYLDTYWNTEGAEKHLEQTWERIKEKEE